MRILFICKYNLFRSRTAEEYFKKINKNKNIKIESRGLIMEGKRHPAQEQLAKELLGINLKSKKPESITINDLIEADKIIVVANDIPKIIFNYHKIKPRSKLTFWRIRDEHYGSKKNIKQIILKIKKKVDKLNKQLEK